VSNHKIIFTGPVGAGKTTAINALSDIPAVRTEQRPSDGTRLLKSSTTVAMDYGVMRLSEHDRVHLYGTPGQARFDFMWEILREGSIGVVVLLDNQRQHPLSDLDQFLDAFSGFTREGRIAVGVTRMDCVRAPDLEAYGAHLARRGVRPPLFEVDARRRRDVATLVRALLHQVEPSLSAHV
jgi:hypothetical protein